MNKVAEVIRVHEAYLFPTLKQRRRNRFLQIMGDESVNEHNESGELTPRPEVGPALDL